MKLIQVPLEQIKKTFRNQQKLIEKELTSLLQKLQEPNASLPELTQRLILLLKKLASTEVEDSLFKKTSARLNYLKKLYEVNQIESDEFDNWSKIRLDYLLCDYLSRQGYKNTCKSLGMEKSIEDLVDLGIIEQTQEVQESLKRKSCQEALKWCAENKSALKKLKSTLEFQLRSQEYIELVSLFGV